MHDRRVRLQRLFRIDHKRQRLVGDVDKLGAVFGERAGVGDDGGDPFADIARLIDGERIALHLRRFEAAHQLIGRGGKFFAGDDGVHAGQRQSGFGVDRNDASTRTVGLHRHGVQHPRQYQIGGITAGAGDEAAIFPHPALLADVAERAWQLDGHRVASRPVPSLSLQGK